MPAVSPEAIARQRERQRVWRAANRSRRIVEMAAYNRLPEVRARNRAYRYARHRSSPEMQVKGLLGSARKRAKSEGREFNITLADLLPLPACCPLLGVEMVYNGPTRFASGPSIDRKDNNKGYVPGNVWVVSLRANKLKTDGTREELEKNRGQLACNVEEIQYGLEALEGTSELPA